ncbi:carboxymuconolactone decarboxylase family protein [Rhizohabitans arisaemae]|uniref:carboxymuconolactone decarboxylase family protein n=1 Tax=Rhizohabitans arisaemae TaxID=2720610 RepID=UPI0024B07243|nr:carboxymuconolactone decarboxylase family protein [Rhizohabitans arisaemae]
MGKMLARATLSEMLRQIRHVVPVRPGGATGLVAEVYGQLERDFGMLAPPVILHSPAPEATAACWMVLRESLMADGRVPRAAKEAVAATVSRGNDCPYCVDIHGSTLRALTKGRYDGDRLDAAGDPALGPSVTWARASGRADTAARSDPPPADHLAELAGVVVAFHYFNRMAALFLTGSPFPRPMPDAARGTALRMLGRVMAVQARRGVSPGLSLGLLPAAAPAADLSWAGGSPTVAGALARAAAALDRAGDRSVPAGVRELVAAELAAWNGEPRGPSRSWVERATAVLPPAERPAGRLALLTALAPYQVDGPVVEGFRVRDPDDSTLVELTAWAAFAAARRVGAWLPSPSVNRLIPHRRSDP